jgi:menaquinol-cytochrome c reductase iron-sulfur subunit
LTDFQGQDAVQSRPGLSRRQFLTYALGGTGAFMASVIVAPMAVSAFDPLRRGGATAFVNTKHHVSDFNRQLPSLIEYLAHREDAWNSADIPARTWVILQEDGTPLAMSPICTHLGCQVNGTLGADNKPAPSQDGPWWFHCPCHGSRYTKYGVNSPDSPAPRPLDVHKVRVDGDGYVWLGALQQRNRSGQVI